jgi:hypothetical protein
MGAPLPPPASTATHSPRRRRLLPPPPPAAFLALVVTPCTTHAQVACAARGRGRRDAPQRGADDRGSRGGALGADEWAEVGVSSRPSELEWWKKQPGDDDYRGGADAARDGSSRGGERGDRSRGDGGDWGRSERSGGGRGSRCGGRGGRGARPRREWEREREEEEEEGPGWWEVPRAERELQYAAAPLEKWQEEKLVVAFARGRRKVSVQQLAADVGLDR